MADRYLVRHPILLDELLDDRLTSLTNETAVDCRVAHGDGTPSCRLRGDAERAMNVTRDAPSCAGVSACSLADLVHGCRGTPGGPPVRACRRGARDRIAPCVARVRAPHCDAPRFAVVAYGKLGGKRARLRIDLDLIFLFDDEHADAPEIYALFARRLVNWLTAAYFERNVVRDRPRLTPNGQRRPAGLRRGAFERYQRNEDGRGRWTWEHQALTRARFCAAMPLARGSKICATRCSARPRAEEALRARCAGDAHAHARRSSEQEPAVDLKHDPGGMVDIEFSSSTSCWRTRMRTRSSWAISATSRCLRIAGDLGLADARSPLGCRRVPHLPPAHTGAAERRAEDGAPARVEPQSSREAPERARPVGRRFSALATAASSSGDGCPRCRNRARAFRECGGSE